jgi:hypothetical protein
MDTDRLHKIMKRIKNVEERQIGTSRRMAWLSIKL